ncbi:MAG: ester cyclase [Acidobacteriota bacterium]
MTRDEVTTLFAERDAILRRGDTKAMAALYADDATIISPLFGVVKGRAAIEKSYDELLKIFNDLIMTTEDIVADGDRVALFFQSNATHTSDVFGIPATGRKFEIHGVLVFYLQDGKILKERRLYDFTGMLMQLGLLKAKAK